VETVEREKNTANLGDTTDTEATLKSKEARCIDIDHYLDLQAFSCLRMEIYTFFHHMFEAFLSKRS
jgi:CMP-N-acetylneuraminic acid synthetase